MSAPDLINVHLPDLTGLTIAEKQLAIKYFSAGTLAPWPVAYRQGRIQGRDQATGLGIDAAITALERLKK